MLGRIFGWTAADRRDDLYLEAVAIRRGVEQMIDAFAALAPLVSEAVSAFANAPRVTNVFSASEPIPCNTISAAPLQSSAFIPIATAPAPVKERVIDVVRHDQV